MREVASLDPMPELPGFALTPREGFRAVRVAGVATRQGGVISAEQLRALGISTATIYRWMRDGRLIRIYPRVFAVGHSAIGIFGRLNAALLYSGPAAALSHQTGAWWRGFIKAEPRTIHISEPGERASQRRLRLHHPRVVKVELWNGLAVTSAARTLRDFAWVAEYADLRRALAQADHLGQLDPVAIYAELGRGRRGSRHLRRAFGEHLPELAATFSVLEERFLALIDEVSLPLPEVNVFVEGLLVDCVWRETRLIVELDGHETHDRTAAIEVDRHREMTLRRGGYRVLRYTWQQVTREGHLVVAELRRELSGLRREPPGVGSKG